MSETLSVNEAVFRAHNERRLDFLRSCLQGRRRDVLDLIPFLLHEDHAKLMGNMHGGSIAGLACFAYSRPLKNVVLRYFPMFQLFDEPRPQRSIEFLALIGSAGTIAFTDESDLDIWVGVDTAAHSPQALDRLREKLDIIENWAQKTAQLEVHFFIVDPAQIHDDNFGGMTKESCGSALGSLLKDEFYRTGMLLEGKLPLFWAVPPESSEADYQGFAAALKDPQSALAQRYIDLGNLRTISVSEYFGAALWQILKGLGSPFKSTLKMALIDKYSAERQGASLLGELYKKEIRAAGAGQADPYLFLVEQLRQFYAGLALPGVRRLLETCFLMRNLISQKIALCPDQTRLSQTLRIGRGWGWSEAEMERLSDPQVWSAAGPESFRRQILEFLVDAYMRIRDRTRDAPVKISDRDMTIVGKKLKSFFEQSPGKVPFEFSFFNAAHTGRIEFEEQRVAGKLQWQVRLLIGNPEKPLFQIVRQMPNVMVACAWCSMNGFWDGRQELRLSCQTSLTETGLKNMMQSLAAFFPMAESENPPIEDLLKDTEITHVSIMPNWDDPEWQQYVKSLIVFYRNSLGEIFYETRSDRQCVDWLVSELLGRRIGLARLIRLKWKVLIATGRISSTRRLSDQLSRTIEKAIAQRLKPPRILR